ncbi:hypothetical protein BH11BAC4_BH11BAC4_23400 [soil metagenome]
MRPILTTLTIVLSVLIFTNSAQAKIWRLNNNGNVPIPAIVADFPAATTLQQVNDNISVVSGDTIHIEQSPTTYGPCIFTKRLIVIGAGYFLNLNPNTQVNTSYGSIVGDLTFYNVAAASCQVYGLQVGNVYMGVNNLVVARCYFPSVSCLIGNATTGNIDGMSLRQCVFGGSIGGTNVIRNNAGTGTVTNMNIYGNIIVPLLYGIALDTRVSGIFKNNIVSVYYNPVSIAGFYVLNNITLSSQGAYANTFTNCNVEYNIGQYAIHFVTPSGTGTIYGLGNVVKSAAQIAFLGGASSDGYYQLAVASEAIGAGKDAVNCGAFAGDYPYKLSGIAPVPNIYVLTVAPISAGASTISVTVTAKGNN